MMDDLFHITAGWREAMRKKLAEAHEAREKEARAAAEAQLERQMRFRAMTAEAVKESLKPGACLSQIADNYGIDRRMLSEWRRQAKERIVAQKAAEKEAEKAAAKAEAERQRQLTDKAREEREAEKRKEAEEKKKEAERIAAHKVRANQEREAHKRQERAMADACKIKVELRHTQVEEKKEEALSRTEEAKASIAELERVLNSAIECQNRLELDKPAPQPPRLQCFVPERYIQDFVLKGSDLINPKTGVRWEDFCENLKNQADTAYVTYMAQLQEWQKAQDIYARYNTGDLTSIEEYCDVVLSNSKYPDCFPREWITDFDLETGTLVVEFRLPSLADMPTVKELKYVASRDVCEEVRLLESSINSLYDCVAYQVCLRTLHELFSNDKIHALKAIVFNGWVKYDDPATGQETQACIVTVHALAEQFNKINLAAIDPKACFRALKGVGSTQLHAMAPVQPILKLNRTDHRFVASMDVASRVGKGTNLAAIGWEDFEHLIREIFEKEFSKNGGEVKVTQSSRDGGVDAVAFDPDPIRGGKIVIQAKRYTNPVGVSAVRDLYGTIQHERAMKGILVTTSTFGPDAYDFVKDKPLTLMDGNNLLFLLSKHGHKTHIDLDAAKKLGRSMFRFADQK